MFSIVIPTHNRLELLKQVVATVIKQEYKEFEVVIFDNASTENILEFVGSLQDERIRYFRSDVFLPVTDSWNHAIQNARGNYTTVLGDDDGLAPNFFYNLNQYISEFHQPEVIYSALYQFFHPGVAPWELDGYVGEVKNAFFFREEKQAFLMSRNDVNKAIKGSIQLRRNFTFNIQAFTFNRNFLNKLSKDGPIFRSPFPDYYLANVALAKASSVLVIPSPLSIAGVSRLSFGFTLFNSDEEKGEKLLNTDVTQDSCYKQIKKYLIDGPMYNTKYVITMAHVKKYLSEMIKEDINFNKYRRLQLFSLLESDAKYFCRKEGKLIWSEQLSIGEKIFLVFIILCFCLNKLTAKFGIRFIGVIKRKILPYDFFPDIKIIDKGTFTNVVEIYDYLKN